MFLRTYFGDNATLMMRRQNVAVWEEAPVNLPIRQNGHPLWAQHPHADVAALYVALPTELAPGLISTSLLADDELVTKYAIHPGDELNVLGYPLGYTYEGGFPVLRSGKIASFPLTPAKDHPFFLLDFRVFQGNSGDPVYIVTANRFYGGGTHVGEVIHFVMGLVSEEVNATETLQGLFESRTERYPLGLAKIIPSAYIVETLNMLPTPSQSDEH